MPDPIICPHCREQLDIPAEYHGRQVRCASCQNIFVATPEGDAPVVHRLPGRSSHADQPRTARRAPDDRDDHNNRPPRRSNIGVVLLLLCVVLTVGGCCGLLNVVTAVQVNPTLTPYTSAEGKFKVEFPGENPTSGPTTNPADEKLTGVQVTAARDYGQERYTVRCYDLKADWQKLPAEDALDQVAKAELDVLIAAPDQRTVTRFEITKHQGFDARDVLAGNGNGITGRDTVLRCILAGKRVYVVAFQSQKVQAEYWWVRQFFLSFEITDPTAKPPKADEPKKEKKQD